jgi:hypothetical protein
VIQDFGGITMMTAFELEWDLKMGANITLLP